jgi:hypothetical protein
MIAAAGAHAISFGAAPSALDLGATSTLPMNRLTVV